MEKRVWVIANLVVVLAHQEGIEYDLMLEDGSSSIRPQQWLADLIRSGLKAGVKGYEPNTAVKTKGIPEALTPHGVEVFHSTIADAALIVPPADDEVAPVTDADALPETSAG